ncbi:PIN domain-containing protein [Nostocoides vanveenii]|uniref:PIN domain-containing protein n=1 Tax=Nostocoides vanveenii TaxID=330835 RepID=UPI0031DC27EE
MRSFSVEDDGPRAVVALGTTGLLDTSVVIDWQDPTILGALPDTFAISVITSAELAAGPLLAPTAPEAARRQARLQEVESRLAPLPFDAAAARSYGLVVAAVIAHGWRPRSRLADLLLAATAHANGLDLYTRNGEDFRGLDDLVRVVAI